MDSSAVVASLTLAPGGICRRRLAERSDRSLGLAAGMLASAAAARVIEAHRYRVRPLDPAVWTLGALSVIGLAALGAWIPSSRASRVEPVQALRTE